MYYVTHSLILIAYLSFVSPKKYITEPICADTTASTNLIKCNSNQERLFIIEQKYSNDFDGQCTEKRNSTGLKGCYAFGQDISEKCNGKQECVLKFNRPSFAIGFEGSNCNFKSEKLIVSYECIPGNFF